MSELGDRLLRVALTGVVPADDPHVIADAQARIEQLEDELRSVHAHLNYLRTLLDKERSV